MTRQIHFRCPLCDYHLSVSVSLYPDQNEILFILDCPDCDITFTLQGTPQNLEERAKASDQLNPIPRPKGGEN